MKRFPELDDKSQRGSKPRCHLLTHGNRVEVAGRLSGLVKPFGSVSSACRWLPDGFACPDEVQLQKQNSLVEDEIRRELKDWWFKVPGGSGPTWDLASQCLVGSGNSARKGLLLVEAKAHWAELEPGERHGKPLDANASCGSLRNHVRIGRAIEEANDGLRALTNHESWALSRDSCYQMANRFAWAWKLVDLGVPVILVYLGFLDAAEMRDQGDPFSERSDWAKCVKAHGRHAIPEEAWDRSWSVGNGACLIPRILACRRSLTAARMPGPREVVPSVARGIKQ